MQTRFFLLSPPIDFSSLNFHGLVCIPTFPLFSSVNHLFFPYYITSWLMLSAFEGSRADNSGCHPSRRKIMNRTPQDIKCLKKKKHNWDRGKTTCHSPITLYQSSPYLLKQCSHEPLKVGLSSTSKNHPYTQPQRSTRSTRSIQDYTKTIETRLKAVRDAPNDNSFEWSQIRRFLSMRLFPLPLWQPP